LNVDSSVSIKHGVEACRSEWHEWDCESEREYDPVPAGKWIFLRNDHVWREEYQQSPFRLGILYETVKQGTKTAYFTRET
jgi:hypothetical protein